jgi:hypothetical protein
MHTLAYLPEEVPAQVQRLLNEKLAAQVLHQRTKERWRGENFPAAWISAGAHLPRRRRLIERLLRTGTLRAVGGDESVARRALEASRTPTALAG